MTEKNTGGRPFLAEQADNTHVKNEVRIDLAMGKMTDKALKHLAKMVNGIDNLKENTQLAVIDRVLRSNKEYMTAKRELEAAKNSTKEEEFDEEDEAIMIDLTSSETANSTKLN